MNSAGGLAASIFALLWKDNRDRRQEVPMVVGLEVVARLLEFKKIIQAFSLSQSRTSVLRQK